ncbi:MAG TPA: glycerol-3-phosphate 1-O-acyltransferase PlsY [Dongiaceae bacterium]|jgi:glycerol-3-phosphate acyltransferase PlsY
MPDPLGGFQYTWPFLAIALGGYLLGSIPFGLILTRLAGLGDIRAIGSGNIGATNVLRTGHKGLAAATLLLDGLKGTAAVLIGGLWGPDAAIFAGAGAFIGHLFPVWLKFKGGKGVATMLGILFGIYWPLGLIAVAVWLLVAFAFRYSSLSALIAAASSPVAAWFLANRQIAQFCLFLAVLVWLRHAANIKRLLKGEESKIRLSSRKSATS